MAAEEINSVVKRHRSVRNAKAFSESPLEGLASRHEDFVQNMKLSVEGFDIRAIARLKGRKPKPVLASSAPGQFPSGFETQLNDGQVSGASQ